MKHFLSIPALALCAMTLMMQASYAACGTSVRTSHGDSWCLNADFRDNGGNFFQTSRWTLENQCEGYDDTLDFKVDLVGTSDMTYNVGDGDSATGSSRADIRGISCCRDSAPTINGKNMCTFTTKESFKTAVRAHCEDSSNNKCDLDNLPE